MKIAIVGTGYVGLVTGTCFAELGVDVTCVDTDASKIERLRSGIIPIYEPNLELLVEKNHKAGRLHFTTSLEEALPEVEIVFSAVGTPPDEDGSADLRYVLQVARTIGRNMERYVLVVTKSTVPVGTAAKVRAAIREEQDKRGVQVPFDVASNPEFLKEGNAIEDFMRPDRVVVGTDSERARDLMTKLYKPLLLNNFRVMFMDIPSAEMTKYAANAMLATRISFINDVANLCQAVGADVNMVRKGIGADSRIGNKFLYPGCGYGGSCFPQDNKALICGAPGDGGGFQTGYGRHAGSAVAGADSPVAGSGGRSGGRRSGGDGRSTPTAGRRRRLCRGCLWGRAGCGRIGVADGVERVPAAELGSGGKGHAGQGSGGRPQHLRPERTPRAGIHLLRNRSAVIGTIRR